MATVQHSALTGASLHEPKGVASADANRVYVADGLGSGAWAKLTTASLDPASLSSVKAFQEQLFHISHVLSSGADGGAFFAGSWQTRPLNTSNVNGIVGSNLLINQILLPAGSYIVMAEAVAYEVDQNQLRLQNITDGSTALTGTTVTFPTTVAGLATLKGKFTILAAKTFELQHRCVTAAGLTGFGKPANFGSDEHYAEVMIWKIS